jgi:cysteine sulfinate desulfinase/cysteine desulfurase-like protein
MKLKGIIDYDLVPFNSAGFVDPHDISRAIKKNTRLVIMSHASNVLGTIQPIEEIAKRCNERSVPLVIDAAKVRASSRFE